MTAFMTSFIYVTTMCHLTISESLRIVPILHEAMYRKTADTAMQIDVRP